MPSEPFRFLHASELRLDEPLAGTGPLESETRILAEDATLSALDNVVEACLAQDVEFMLLTGTAFGSGGSTLRARSALVSAFENLREFEIRVFWDVGREELAGVVTNTAGLPDNVTPIHPGDAEPVAVVRQGRVIASVCSAHVDQTIPRTDAGQGDREERGAFRIGLTGHFDDTDRTRRPELQHSPSRALPVATDSATSEFDYLALNSTGPRLTHRTRWDVAHHPGPAQGIVPDDAGSHGATLVVVGADRGAELDFIPTAPVRCERILVGVDRDSTCRQLAERMQSALLELEPSLSEQLWIVNWQLIGNGKLFNALQDGDAVEELLDIVNRGLTAGSSVRRVHQLRFRRRLAQHTDDFTQQICDWIERDEANPVEEVLRELHDLPGPTWLNTVNESLPLVAAPRARDAATRLSQELLMQSAQIATQPEQESR